ncbi:MAG: hypothetical protein N3H30_01745 [Candidatus Micrarchaeota archaeon]|nr:hypothetical protein [Candidatus Micrarchaeota archaeon]
MGNCRRGQSSVEFLAVVAMLLLLIVPVFLYFYWEAPQRDYYASVAQAESCADEIVKYGELVGVQGTGTKVSRIIVVPKYAERIELNGSHVMVRVAYAGMSSEIVRIGPVNFSSTQLEIAGGAYPLVFENKNGVVYVSRQG